MEKHILNDEQKKKLLGLMPVKQGAKLPFTPECLSKLSDDIRPVYYQRVLTKEERDGIRDFETDNYINISPYLGEDNKNSIELMKLSAIKAKKIHEFARLSIVGWDKVYCPATGEPIEFKADSTGAIDIELYSSLNDAIKVELYENMKTISSLTDLEKLGLE